MLLFESRVVLLCNVRLVMENANPKKIKQNFHVFVRSVCLLVHEFQSVEAR